MKSPAFGLDSRAPLEMMGTHVEAQAVIDLIGRLETGTHAQGVLCEAAVGSFGSASVATTG